jgi:RHH-type rel operon transcriptional repressor/antitoxin RelB
MVSVRLPKEIDHRLEHLAKLTKRTKSYYILEALTSYLEEVEDVYIALHRLEKPAKRWSLEELEKEIDLDD